jgi:hypothetical protein
MLDAAWTGFDASASQLSIGKNPIGGSTTGPLFSGVVLSARHRPLNEFLSMATNEDSTSDNSRRTH